MLKADVQIVKDMILELAPAPTVKISKEMVEPVIKQIAERLMKDLLTEVKAELETINKKIETANVQDKKK